MQNLCSGIFVIAISIACAKDLANAFEDLVTAIFEFKLAIKSSRGSLRSFFFFFFGGVVNVSNEAPDKEFRVGDGESSSDDGVVVPLGMLMGDGVLLQVESSERISSQGSTLMESCCSVDDD